MINLAIFASGNASDLPAIQEDIKHWDLKWKVKIACWVINKEWVWAVEKFQALNIPYFQILTKWKDRNDVYQKINHLISSENIDLIICIWWMNIMPSFFVEKWEWKIINVHPSLLPKYPWAYAIEDALKAWEKTIGCSIHFIDEWIDTWKIILQKKIEVLEWENISDIKKKMQVAEQDIYPKAILEVVSNTCHSD